MTKPITGHWYERMFDHLWHRGCDPSVTLTDDEMLARSADQASVEKVECQKPGCRSIARQVKPRKKSDTR